MFTRAVIFKKDHQNTTRYLGKKLVTNKLFKHQGAAYTINDKHFQIVKAWRFGWKWNTVTYYYREGDPTPLPVPEFGDLVRAGIQGEELEKIFTPWYYQIRVPGKNSVKDITFWLQVAILAGVGYLIMQVRKMVEMLEGVGL